MYRHRAAARVCGNPWETSSVATSFAMLSTLGSTVFAVFASVPPRRSTRLLYAMVAVTHKGLWMRSGRYRSELRQLHLARLPPACTRSGKHVARVRTTVKPTCGVQSLDEESGRLRGFKGSCEERIGMRPEYNTEDQTREMLCYRRRSGFAPNRLVTRQGRRMSKPIIGMA